MRGEVVRLKYVAGINQRSLAEDTDEDYEFVYVDIGSVTTGHMQLSDSNIKFGDAPSRARRLAGSGDTVISTVRTYLKAVAEVPSVDEAELVFSTGFAVVHPHTNITDSRYLSYAMQADSFTQAVEAHSVGVSYPAVNASDVGNVRIWLPDVGEQRIIAEFLDRETAQIDAMIDAQQRLVSLLSERRLSTISEFVRSGVDGAVPTTTTGLPWLPQVPVTWRVVPAKAVFAQRTETSRPDDTHLTPSQQYGVMPQHEYMELTGNKVVLNLTGADNMRHVEPDDFVIHLRSFQGGIEHSKYRGKVSMAYTVLTPRPGAVPDYFRWVLKSSTYVQALQTTTNQLRDGQSIKYAEFATIPLPFPPEEQQRGIAAHLSGEIAQIDRMRQKVEHSIALLRERRAAVITAAVTGRLDPRTGVERVEEMLEGATL